jgi:hypothetical protein
MFATTTKRFLTAAVKHTPPKKIYSIPGRYAGAVYTAASKVSFFSFYFLN